MTPFIKQLWRTTEEGVFVPSGNVLEASNRKKTNFLQVKARAKEIEGLYAKAGLKMSPACGLAQMIGNAKALADRWLCNQTDCSSMFDAFCALHLDRIAEAILPLRDVPGSKKYLKDLMSGELDFFGRQPSFAKNIFWEVELWSILRRSCPSTSLKDPPDISLQLSGGSLGVSCKKIYSEKNVEKVLSEAVGQVKAGFDVGVVAFNLDDLTPPDTILRVRNKAEMDRSLQRYTDDFLVRHERHFRKYLASGRVVSVLVSVHVIAHVQNWNVQFNNSRSAVAWTIPGLTSEKEVLLQQFRDIAVVSHKLRG